MINSKILQSIQLDILSVTIETLQKHGINVYLIGGSCIGAVRHGGMIPWDDDIDIGLFRDDYENACEILRNELPEGYTWCDHLTEKEYPYNFGKVRKDNTAFVHGGDAHLNIHHGIYIDVFPLDKVPADLNEFKSILRKVTGLRRKVDLKCMSYKKHGKLRPIWQLPIIAAAHLLVNKQKVQSKLDALIKAFADIKDTQYICNYFGVYGEREKIKSEWFGEGMEIMFESVSAIIPSDYDSYLTHVYGDYMKLPPEEKRVSHHDGVFISTTESYHPFKK